MDEDQFTFQYGYFIVSPEELEQALLSDIYIPIWLFYSKLFP